MIDSLYCPLLVLRLGVSRKLSSGVAGSQIDFTGRVLLVLDLFTIVCYVTARVPTRRSWRYC